MATEVQFKTPRLVSRNPATGEFLAEFPCLSEEEVHDAVDRAVAAQRAWAALGVRGRTAILRRFQRILADRKQSVARTITLEAGKPSVESLSTEVLVVLDAARFCIEHVYEFLRARHVPHGNLITKAKRGYLLREPYGVVGIIAPWNYPFSTPASETLAALATGNAVVLKPSEFTSMAAAELVSLLHESGVPRDVLQLVTGNGRTGSALITSRISKLIFTGSVATGKQVAQAAANRLLPVVLELGGKDPLIVLQDADVKIAAAAAVWGAFMNAGQTCLSVERCYVHRTIYDSFVHEVVERTKRLHVGNGMDPSTDVGPMIHERQIQIVERQVGDARNAGAQVLVGGMRLPELGPNFYAPTVLIGVTNQMAVMREETFGPVLPIMPFDTEDQVVDLANDSDFGLAASIWTRDPSSALRLARRIQAGTVMINDVLTCFGTSEAPHGGIKASGIGRTHGFQGLEEMVWSKYVDSDVIRFLPKPWWYPYNRQFQIQLEAMIDFLFGRGLGRLTGGLKALPALLRNRKSARHIPF